MHLSQKLITYTIHRRLSACIIKSAYPQNRSYAPLNRIRNIAFQSLREKLIIQKVLFALWVFQKHQKGFMGKRDPRRSVLLIPLNKQILQEHQIHGKIVAHKIDSLKNKCNTLYRVNLKSKKFKDGSLDGPEDQIFP